MSALGSPEIVKARQTEREEWDLNKSSEDCSQKSQMTEAGPSGEEVEFHVL